MSASCPSKPVLDQLADWARWESELNPDPAGVESALVARLSQVRDLRRRRGLRHRLVVILVLAACATLVTGSDSVTAIWQWAARAPQDKLARLGARWNPFTRRFVVPSERTFRRVLATLDADGLDAAVGEWVADVARGVAPAPVVPVTPGPPEREQRRAVQRATEHPVPRGVLPGAAVDGKALRGARTDAGPVFLVGAIDHARGAVLGQRQVPSKRGEGVAARDLLTGLDVPGMVWTLDALHTTRTTARLITEDLHGHYVLIIKGNQCAARRLVISPVKLGGIRRGIPGSDGSPGSESGRGPKHASKPTVAPGVRRGASGDPRDMAKARLPEPQFPAGATLRQPERHLKPVPTLPRFCWLSLGTLRGGSDVQ